MQLKMAKRLQSISSLALNHIAMDTESDYDTDDMETTLTDAHKLKLSDGLTSLVADTHRLKLKDLDSSEGEGLYDFDDGTIKRRTSKKKKRVTSKQNPVGNGGGDSKDGRTRQTALESQDRGRSSASSTGSVSTEAPTVGSTTSISSEAPEKEAPPMTNGDVLSALPTAKTPTCDTTNTTLTTTTTTNLNGALPTQAEVAE